MSGPMLITKCWCSESFESSHETHHHWWTSLCVHIFIDHTISRNRTSTPFLGHSVLNKNIELHA